MAPQHLARIAGILYLVLAVAGGFSQLVVRGGVLVSGDAGATADNIRASAGLVQLGFVTDVINIVCFIGVGLVLHALLSPVNRRIAGSFVIFNALAVAIMGVSLAAHAGALLVATDPGFAASLGANGADAITLLLMEMHARGYLVAEVFFGLWLLPLGYVVYRSGFLPARAGRRADGRCVRVSGVVRPHRGLAAVPVRCRDVLRDPRRPRRGCIPSLARHHGRVRPPVRRTRRRGPRSVLGRSPGMTAQPTDNKAKSAWLPPRWVIRTAWAVHRGIYRLSGGRRGLKTATPAAQGMMRLTTVGRRSGKERAVIVGYYEDGPNLVTMAMNGWGEPEPAWWLNLQARPDATVEVPGRTVPVRARAATLDERPRLWERWREYDGADLDSWAARRPRETAVVIFEPREPSAR